MYKLKTTGGIESALGEMSPNYMVLENVTNRVIFLFVLAQLTIGYGWASMAYIWN